jgi:hypothetical protein
MKTIISAHRGPAAVCRGISAAARSKRHLTARASAAAVFSFPQRASSICSTSSSSSVGAWTAVRGRKGLRVNAVAMMPNLKDDRLPVTVRGLMHACLLDAGYSTW